MLGCKGATTEAGAYLFGERLRIGARHPERAVEGSRQIVFRHENAELAVCQGVTRAGARP